MDSASIHVRKGTTALGLNEEPKIVGESNFIFETPRRLLHLAQHAQRGTLHIQARDEHNTSLSLNHFKQSAFHF
jgi:hypothetical protein